MNSIYTIIPYKWQGNLWYFDDDTKGLKQEAFMQGISEIIDSMVENLSSAENGFLLTFSATPFPQYTHILDWFAMDTGGNWYKDLITGVEGWLCPALYKYFEKIPKTIYAKADSLN